MFFTSKCSIFHNSNVFGSCIIHILFTERAKIKKKIRPQNVKQSSRWKGVVEHILPPARLFT